MTETALLHRSLPDRVRCAGLQIVEAPDGRPALVLDRTAFYPTSGGQPFDTGTIGAAAIADVIDQDDGTILHVLSERVGGAPV